MELVLDEAQTILRESADKLVERHAGPARFRELRTTEHGFDPARLAVVAEAGWLSLLVPEERDGLGLGTTEAALVLESAGRGLMTEPIAAVMAAARAVASGPAAMGATLEGLTSGGSVILPALHDPAADDPAGARVQATPAGSDFKLSGRTGAVPGAPAADGFIVNARSGDGTVVCLVPRDAHGLEIQQRGRVDGTGHATLALNGVTVPADAVIASGAQGTEVAAATLDLVLLGTSAEMLGIMEQGAGAGGGLPGNAGAVRPPHRLLSGASAPGGQRPRRHRAHPLAALPGVRSHGRRARQPRHGGRGEGPGLGCRALGDQIHGTDARRHRLHRRVQREPLSAAGHVPLVAVRQCRVAPQALRAAVVTGGVRELPLFAVPR